ncbi:STE3-domain-containing protein [Dendrothele bispora CBS 962.96]|uniref:STE3-domain-containing protein n=1 Tax=Dendrothele bispora (strain CBS 962.96) TaxID=1314807 RepID=A0A4S8MJ64_DENBC|nr:STE3-domain-containing protein [Dendrothele bispora CBS 962.96]
MSSAVTDILFSALSFLTCGLLFITLLWHIKARNAGTCLFILWIGLACLVLAVDSIIWRTRRGSVETGPIFTWCDISTKFLVGVMAAIPAVSLCINLRLYFISTDKIDLLERKSMIITEYTLGLGFPIIEMILHYVVQGHRFDIYGAIGCRPFISNVLLAYILLFAPQLLLAVGSCVLLILTIIASREIYKKINLLHPGIHDDEGSPLMFLWFSTLGGLSAISSIAYDSYLMYVTLRTGDMKIWVPWNEMHNTSYVDVIPQSSWKSDPMLDIMVQVDRWIYVGLGLLFFAFFGFTREARRVYGRFFRCGAKQIEEEDELTDEELKRIMKSRNLIPLNGPQIISKPDEAFRPPRRTSLPPLDGRPGSFLHASPDETFNSVKEKVTKQSNLSGPPLMPNDTSPGFSSSNVIYSSDMSRFDKLYSSAVSSPTSPAPFASGYARSLMFPSPTSPPNLPLPPVPHHTLENYLGLPDRYSSSPSVDHSLDTMSTYSMSASSLPLISKVPSTAHIVYSPPLPDVIPPARLTTHRTPAVQRSRSLSTSARGHGPSLSVEGPTNAQYHRRSRSAYRGAVVGGTHYAQGYGPSDQSFLELRPSRNDPFSGPEHGIGMAM